MPSDDRAAPAVVLCRCDHGGGGPATQDDGTVRCACGSLLARYFRRTIELKCRRCKRTVMVPQDRDAATSG